MPEHKREQYPLRYRLEWWGLRAVFWLFRKLGRKRSSAFGGWLGRVVGPWFSAHTIAKNNIAKALPKISAPEQAAILRQMWDNLGRNIAEFPFLGQLDFDSDDVELVGAEHLQDYLKTDKTALFVTAHYGPWELTTSIGKYCQKSATIIYRAANNPLVNEYLQDQREDPFIQFSPKGKHGAKALLKAIKNKQAIALLNDQKLNQGLPIPFFGREAMTASAVAELSCRYDLPIYPVKAERLSDGKFRVTVYAPIKLPKSGELKPDVVQILTHINGFYEDWIRERPDHWFWVHNRWSD